MHHALGANRRNPGLVPHLELADQRHLHAADEADVLRLRHQPRDRADEVRPFLLAKDEARDVGRRAPKPKGRSPHTRSARRGKSRATRSTSARKMKPTPMTRFDAARGEQAHRRLAVLAPHRLEVRPVNPSSRSARSSPVYAASLKLLSPRPPTSKTRPTRTRFGTVADLSPASSSRRLPPDAPEETSAQLPLRGARS